MLRRYLSLGLLLGTLCASPFPARAADLAGVHLPDTQTMAGQTLVLNGTALRTYSILAIHIYVAGLYLPQQVQDAAAVLDLAGPKWLELHFLHDVTAAQARRTWHEELAASCGVACAESGAARDYLASVADTHAGDTITLAFEGAALRVRSNGQLRWQGSDPSFSRAVLAVFVGPKPADAAVQRGLLGRK